MIWYMIIDIRFTRSTIIKNEVKKKEKLRKANTAKGIHWSTKHAVSREIYTEVIDNPKPHMILFGYFRNYSEHFEKHCLFCNYFCFFVIFHN